MPNATEPRPSPSLGTRLFLATALVIVVAIGGAVLVTSLLGRGIARNAAKEALARAGGVVLDEQDRRFEQLRLIARLFVSDPYFTAYVTEAVAAGDRLSVFDQLDERQQDFGADFAIILDAEGRVVARTDLPDAASEDLSNDPLVIGALEAYQAYGVWARSDGLFHAVAVPITSANLLTGFLIAGYAIDQASVRELGAVTDTDIMIVDATPAAEVLAGDLGAPMAEALRSGLDQRDAIAGQEGEPFALSLDGAPWLALTVPLYDAGEEVVANIVCLASLTERLRPYERIRSLLLAVGAGAALVALLLSYLLPRRLLAPVRRLATAARAAAGGDYDQTIEVARRDEVGELAGAFSTLLAELREKRDMELYINELARNLPEQPATAASTLAITQAPAEDRLVTLLGMQLRSPSSHAEAADAARALELLTADLRHIAGAVTAQGGRIEAVLGRRVMASFAGDRRTTRAIAGASAVLQANLGAQATPALVLTSGRLVTGVVAWDEKPQRALAGDAVDHLENLLRIAKPGDLLISRSAYAELAAVYRQAGRNLATEPGFGQTLPLFALDRDTATAIIGRDAQTTWSTPGAAAKGRSTLGSIGPGSLIGNRFEVLSVLGSGGMGVVYKARDRELEELVAVKMLKSASVDHEQMERLKIELKLARRITHPNILRTFDFGEVDGVPFITMEYVRGITLRQLLDRSGRLPLSAGLRLARQLCTGLSVAHAEGVLHRDIKPENLIVEPTGNAKLMDFGIARPLRRAQLDGTNPTEPGAILGTPYYLSPEQVNGEEPDPRADLYACGVLFYEVFTGALPFAAKGTIIEILRRKLEDAPIPPRERWAAIPPTLEAIILRCLERERGDRYPDVAALLEALQTVRS